MANISEILRTEKLRVDYPEQQDGLTVEVGAAEAPVDYENSYKIGYKVPCAFCPKKTPHQWGITAVMEDGRRALCGNCCAKRLFGSDVHKKLNAELSKRERSAIAKHMYGPLVDGITSVIEELKEHWLPVEKRVIDANLAIQHQLPSDWRSRMNDNGRITVKDWDGEVAGRVKGVDALTHRTRRLFEGTSHLHEIKTYLEADASEQRILFARDKQMKAVRSFELGFEALQKAQVFYKTDENLNLLGSWAANKGGSGYEFSVERKNAGRNRALRLKDGWGNQILPIQIPNGEEIEALPSAAVILALLKEPS